MTEDKRYVTHEEIRELFNELREGFRWTVFSNNDDAWINTFMHVVRTLEEFKKDAEAAIDQVEAQD